MEIHFDFLVDMFSFSIRLGVIGHEEGEIISEGCSKLLGKDRGKLGTAVRDDYVIEAEPCIDFMEKESGHTRGGDSFLGGA